MRVSKRSESLSVACRVSRVGMEIFFLFCQSGEESTVIMMIIIIITIFNLIMMMTDLLTDLVTHSRC